MTAVEAAPTGPSGAPAGEARRLVLVVGVGRSGTSAFTKIMQNLDFRVPEPEVEADATNPRGFGEPRWVVDFHQRLLREHRVRVFDSRPAAWDQISIDALGPDAYAELRAWLSVQFVAGDDVIVKDPRSGWFLPLWLRCADELGIETSFVTMLRHPAEIANSARKWYGSGQSDASRTLSWVNEMLHTEHATRGTRRAFVRYQDLLTDCAASLDRVGEVLGLDRVRERTDEQMRRIDEFVDPQLHRSKVTWSDVEVPQAARAIADAVWQQLYGLAEPGGDAAATWAVLDELRAGYVTFYAEAEAIAQSSIIAARMPRKPAAGAPKQGASSTASAADEVAADEGGDETAGEPVAAAEETTQAVRPARPASASLPGLAGRVVRRIPPRYRRRVPVRWRRRARRLVAKVARAVR